VFVDTNQGGVGLALYPETTVHAIHDAMTSTLARGGAQVDGWFYCPHHPEARIEALRVDCACRKPKPGLVRQAADAFEIDLPRSFVVGDKLSDVDLARGVGARGVLVRTGYGDEVLQAHAGVAPGAAYVAADLMAATAWLLDASLEKGRPA
jgi:D-glycero-D-manno-heptose 1,7-bisphosphate phosphatase